MERIIKSTKNIKRLLCIRFMVDTGEMTLDTYDECREKFFNQANK